MYDDKKSNNKRENYTNYTKNKKTVKNVINLPARSPSVVPSSDNLAGGGWCYGNYSIEQEHSSYVV